MEACGLGKWGSGGRSSIPFALAGQTEVNLSVDVTWARALDE